MQKLVLMSVIFASIIIPARAARLESPEAGLKKVVKQTAIFNVNFICWLKANL